MTRWIADHESCLRLGVASDGVNSNILYRETEDAEWTTIAEYSFTTEHEVVRAWAARLAADAFAAPMLARLQVRLRAMGEWLHRAEEGPLARLVDVAAQTVGNLPPEQHPLIVSMIELGLNIAMHALP